MITGKEIWGMMGNYSGSGNWTNVWHNSFPMVSGLTASAMAIFLITFLFMGIVWAGIWIYTSFAYMNIAKKLKYKRPWLAWIPFARGAMILQLGNFPWGWVFLWSPLVLLPLVWVGWPFGVIAIWFALVGAIAFTVLCYISHWRFFEKRGYYGWLALVPLVGVISSYLSFAALVAFLIIIGFVAWKDGDMIKPKRSQRSSRGRKRRR